MPKPNVYTLDLNFQGIPGTIAAYLIPHQNGAALIECGPGSTLPGLRSGLETHGLSEKDITHIFLTHIHLDHAGAAGWLAQQGAKIYVHPVGAPHLINPEKLLASATRLYGDGMEELWGDFLAVPHSQLNILQDNDIVEIDDFCIRAIDTPGHASHHYSYIFEDICFTGDIGGVRMSHHQHIRLPMPPPEFQPEQWRLSLQRLRKESFSRIAPTHFGIFSNPDWHLSEIERILERTDAWMMATLPNEPSLEQLRTEFTLWERQTSLNQGVNETAIREYETANPSFMSADGIQRYWKKFRQLQ